MKQKSSSRPRAIALTYNPEHDNAPVVAAKGAGELARKILSIARERNIPIRKDPDLIALLASVDVLEEVPPDLYTAVAEILAFIYRVNEKKGIDPENSENRPNYAERNLHGSSGDDAPPDKAGSDSQQPG